MRRRYLFTLAAAVAILVAPPAFASDLSSLLANHEKDNFKLIHVSDLERLMAAKDAQVYVYDADPPDYRHREGVIPGAKLLPSSDRYDVATELPADKSAKLVFYCYNLRCMASHAAARRAAKAGYTDVSVMVDGIDGWKKAGMSAAMLK